MGLYTCCRIPRQLWGTGPSLQPRTFVQRRFRPHVDVRLGADKGKLCPAPSQKILRRAWCNGGQASAASDDAAAGFDINLGGYDPEVRLFRFPLAPLSSRLSLKLVELPVAHPANEFVRRRL